VTVLRNPALLLAIALPAAAVVASFVTLGITLAHPDSQLPEQYHWEGFQLDRDFSRAERASALGVRATFRNISSSGVCEIELQTAGAPPERLELTLAHATLPRLDQHVQFHRVSTEADPHAGRATYAAQCVAMPDAHWRLELSDAAQSWSVRSSVRGSLARVQLDATTAEDD
jgi:hypothetical protein